MLQAFAFLSSLSVANLSSAVTLCSIFRSVDATAFMLSARSDNTRSSRLRCSWYFRSFTKSANGFPLSLCGLFQASLAALSATRPAGLRVATVARKRLLAFRAHTPIVACHETHVTHSTIAISVTQEEMSRKLFEG